MAILASDILDYPCDNDDEKMETIYQIDFIKKGKFFFISRIISCIFTYQNAQDQFQCSQIIILLFPREINNLMEK